MKKFATLLISLTSLLSSYAQVNTFQIAMPENGLQSGMCIGQTSDGGYVIGANYSFVDSASQTCNRPVIVKMDALGNKVWEKKICINFNPSVIRQTPEGGYIMFGSMLLNHKAPFAYGGLIKLNAQGDTVWCKFFANLRLVGLPLSPESMTLSSDSGFVMIGKSGQNMNGAYIQKVSANGDSIWSHVIGGNTQVMGSSIQQSNDGGFILAGNNGGNMMMIKTDASGDSIWMKSINNNAYSIKGLSVKQVNDGGYVILGQSSNSTSDLFVAKTTAQGDTLWTRNYNNPNTNFGNAVIYQTSNKGYIILGDDSSNPLMIKTDSTGALAWVKKYTEGSNVIIPIYSSLIANDNGLVECGFYQNYNLNESSLFLRKTDDNGNWINAILGNLFVDKNHNCSKDAGEISLANRQVVLNPGFVVTNTDSLGNYSFNVPAGTYTVTLPDAEYYGLSCPGVNGYTVNFPSLGDTASNKNFADTTQSSCPDLTVSINTCGFGACFKNTYYVNYSNQGTVADSNVVITMSVDSNIIFLSSSTPWNATGAHTYSFNIGSLQPGQSGSINILDSVSCTAPMGVNACVNAHIAGSISECDTTDNLSTDCHTINSSMDPNERQVKSQAFHTNGYVTEETIQAKDRLSFLVTFQNTGTAPAMNVTVTDSLSSLLDLSTLEPISASAPYSYSVNSNGLVVWHLNNIMLADSGHNQAGSVGFIRYRISQKAGNPGGSVIRTRSSVVFDLNKPVLTNATVNTILLVTGEAPVAAQAPSATRIYPNPSNGSTNIEINTQGINAGSEIRCSVYDAVGKELSSVIIPAGAYSATQANTLVYPMELSSLGAGMYFYSVRNGNNMIGSGKMVIR